MTELDDEYSPKADQIEARYGRRRAARERQDLRTVLDSEEGRRLIWRLCSDAGVMTNAHHVDPTRRDYALGRQSVGQDIVRWIESIQVGAFFALAEEMAKAADEDSRAREREIREALRDDP